MLMKVSIRLWVAVLALALPSATHADELEGPARFCGYSPIIDLLPGERVATLGGGIHGGTFRWTGDFGSLEVRASGWSKKPKGRVAVRRNAKGYVRYVQRRIGDDYVVTIWNRSYGMAQFHSTAPLTKAQLQAIDRVDLFDEGQEPEGCKLRTIFSWE
jgi:hypothetical protein